MHGIAAGQAVLVVYLERSHSSHELPGIMVAFGRDRGADRANLRDLGVVVGRRGLFVSHGGHTTLLTAQAALQGAESKAPAVPESVVHSCERNRCRRVLP